VIFVIRTRGNPLRSKPSAILLATALTVVVAATALPYTSLGARLGFVPVPGLFFVILAGMVIVYLVMVQAAKTWFYRRFAPR
jgi:Mg2+-importing ATPase